MPLPFIATLPRAARLFLPIAEGGVARGLSANRIIDSFRAGGGAIRRQTALDVIRRVKGVEAQSSQLQFLRRGFTPDPRRLPEALTALKRAFSFTVRLKGYLVETGEEITRHVTVALDRLQSRATIEQEGFDFAQPEPEQYGLVITEVMLVGGKKAGLPGTLF